MTEIQNKHGPDFDVGIPIAGRPRDGTERRARDGTERRPRDGTERKPRDEMMPRKDISLNGYKYLITRQPIDVKIHGKPFSRWRFNDRKRPALRSG